MKKNFLLPIFFSVIILNSCTQYYYTPNSENVPLLTQKSEVAGTINYYPTFTGGSGIEFQTAYAAGNHVAIQINGGGGSGSDNSTIPDIIGGGNGETTNAHGGGGYFEGGVGYFLPFGPRKRFVFESATSFNAINLMLYETKPSNSADAVTSICNDGEVEVLCHCTVPSFSKVNCTPLLSHAIFFVSLNTSK